MGVEHDSSAESEDCREEDETPSSSEVVTDDKSKESAEEGAGLVDGDDVGLCVVELGGGQSGEAKLLCEGGKSESGADEGFSEKEEEEYQRQRGQLSGLLDIPES